ncbi:hypothetical protein D3C81_1713720 [compost metagenome]
MGEIELLLVLQLQRGLLTLQLHQLVSDLRQARFIRITGKLCVVYQRHPLCGESHLLRLQLDQSLRFAVQAHANPRTGGINQIHRFVR